MNELLITHSWQKSPKRSKLQVKFVRSTSKSELKSSCLKWSLKYYIELHHDNINWVNQQISFFLIPMCSVMQRLYQMTASSICDQSLLEIITFLPFQLKIRQNKHLGFLRFPGSSNFVFEIVVRNCVVYYIQAYSCTLAFK